MSKTYVEQAKAIIELLISKGAKPLGYGSNKATFSKGNYIYKIAKGVYSVIDILNEHSLYAQSTNGILVHHGVKIRLAKCRIAMVNKFPILIMEKLVPVSSEDSAKLYKSKRNNWMSSIGDGRQVGKNRRGKYIAFDFGGSTNLSIGLYECSMEWATHILNDMGIEDAFNSNMVDHYVSQRYLESIGVRDSYGSPTPYFINDKKNILKFA